MRKVFLIGIIYFSTVVAAQSQNIKATASNKFVTHKVSAGESLFGLARKYNLEPKALADFNNLPIDKGLVIGQTIKIPASNGNAAPVKSKAGGQSPGTVYHTVAKSETLFRIANTYNVSIEDIRRWNNLTGDNIAAGTSLIVGLGNSSARASAPKEVASAKTTNVNSEPAGNISAPEANSVITNQTEATNVTSAQPTDTKKEEAIVAASKPEEKQVESVPVKTEPAPVTTETSSLATTSKQESAVSTNDQNKIDLLAPVPETSNEGVFEGLYPSASLERSLTNKTGEAATFKSTSGWQDKKYYVLINDVSPGTILKIASVDNKVVFAKVLGSLPEMKENKGLLLRMSNAAASYLGMIDPKFPVQVTFYQ